MNDPMTILKADHRDVKSMLKTLAESEEGKDRNSLCEKVSVALSLHMKIEEELVYALIREHVGDEEDEEANVEHGLAKDGLALMVSMLTKPGFGASVEMLAGGINHHVEEEESELLPELKSALTRADWLKLGDQIAAIKESAGEAPRTPSRRRAAKRPRAKVSSNA
jgi:hemerythrin-like domain-containing protein